MHKTISFALKSSIVLLMFLISIPAAFATFTIYKVTEDNGVSSDYLELVLAPGVSETHYVAVYNLNDETKDYSVSAVDAVYDDATGAFSLTNPNFVDQTGVGVWASLPDGGGVTVEPDDMEKVKVVFDIPEDAELGTYWGAMLALELQEANAEESVVLGQVGLRTKIDIVPMEEYVPQEVVDVPVVEEDAESNTLLPYYIAAAVIITVAAVAIAMPDKKKKKK